MTAAASRSRQPKLLASGAFEGEIGSHSLRQLCGMRDLMLQYGERQPLDDWRDQRRIALRRNIGQFSHHLNAPA